MEKLKDLDILLSEATRIHNTLRIFEELPKILEVVQASQNLLKEMEDERDKVKAEKSKLKGKLSGLKEELVDFENILKSKREELASLSETMKTRKAVLVGEMEEEMGALRLKREGELEKQEKEIRLVMRRNEQAMIDSKQEAARIKAISEAEIEKYRNAEKEARQRAEKALADFEKIKESLLGGK